MDRVSSSLLGHAFTGQSAMMLTNRETGRGRDRQFYHSLRHSFVHVAERTDRLLKLAGASAHERTLGRYAALGHDWIQNYTARTTDDGKFQVRARDRGPNEEASAEMVTDVLTALDSRLKGNDFHPGDIEMIGTAIRNTFPAWNADHKTIWQPKLHEGLGRWNKVEWAVAVADLSAPGLDPQCYLQEGTDLALEEQFSIMEELQACKCRGDLPWKRQQEMHGQLLGWFGSQVGFARGRKALFQIEAAMFPAVLAKFCRFDESIALAEARVRRYELMPFWAVAHEVGFPVPLA